MLMLALAGELFPESKCPCDVWPLTRHTQWLLSVEKGPY